MPCDWERTPSGTILVHPCKGSSAASATYVYARVSSYAKKEDLERQLIRCKAFCEANGWPTGKCYKEVASGMNDNRRKLHQLFEQPPGRLVVEHKDRLTRFGFRYIEALLLKLGWEVVVINQDEDDQTDLMKDLVAIITSFCCRLYGLRRGHQKSKEIQEQCAEPSN